MKKLRKLKLQNYETLSNSEMKNIIGADYISSAYTCSTSSGKCGSASGVCGSIGNIGICAPKEEYQGEGYYVAVGCICK